MNRTYRYAIMALFVLTASVLGQQSSPYVLTDFPITAVAGDSKIWIKWAGIARPTYAAPDSGVLYYDRVPGGGKVANYKYQVSNFCVDTQKMTNGTILSMQVQNNIFMGTIPPKRGLQFRPIDQPGMEVGVFYYMVAFKTKLLGKDTVLYSNELQMIVESKNPVLAKAPQGNISQLTPTFTWDPNPGVPYYHVILSDEPLAIDTTGGMNIKGLSIVWQAITTQTQMVYGAPDPSGTITASPPPLSPGQSYSWVVLNNYGNNPALTSTKYGLPKTFTITGTPLTKPVLIHPKNDTLTSKTDSVVTFKWTNLDAKANTYKVYVYMSYSASGATSVNAKLVVWQNEVTTGTFAGKNGIVDATDTGSVSINARDILTNNSYSWKVFAVDNAGASTASDTAGFRYYAPATGTLKIYTREKINIGTASAPNYVINPVTAVALNVEVLNGSLEAPLLFYTDLSGNIVRDRPVGTYRITSNKSGFVPLVKTITLDSAMTIKDTFYLERPMATLYGKINDETGVGLNMAEVVAVSERNDTVFSQSDALGSFIVNCRAGDWVINGKKNGYIPSLQVKVTVADGENKNINPIVLKMNPLTLSGFVKNSTGSALLGADVKIIQDGKTIADFPSTPQDGSFSFSVGSGTYTLYATKVGFTTYNKVVNVSSSMQMTLIMPAGAALITGSAIGRTWIGSRQVFGPITNATIKFTDTTSSVHDTFSTTSDATYGTYSISVPGGHLYKMLSSVSGFASHSRFITDTLKGGTTITINDTVDGLGMLTGIVKLGSTKATVANATVSLVSLGSNQVRATVNSQANGYFEIRNIADGEMRVTAGANGLVTDSIVASDTVFISSGRSTIQGKTNADNLVVYMSPGIKTIAWNVNNGGDVSSSVKLLSPIQKNISVTDSLKNAGSGNYIVAIDGLADSIIDLSYHLFNVGVTEIIHTDSILLPVANHTADTLLVQNDSVQIALSSTIAVDSAVLYFRDVATSAWDSVKNKSVALQYSFKIKPTKDGSNLLYYFKVFKGKDIYGYSQETFAAYVKPDLSKLTKLEMVPSITDTILLPASYDMMLSVKGYFGSQFVESSLDSTAISWQFEGDAQGNSIGKSTGVSTILKTGSQASTKPVILHVGIDTSKIKVDFARMPLNGVDIFFNNSGKKIAIVRVKRTDAKNGLPISTSSLARAEFTAEGTDSSKNVVSINPTWSIIPEVAGTISSSGVFKPSKKFAGIVHVWAKTGVLSGEYVNSNSTQNVAGIEVQHQVVQSNEPDTIITGTGCLLVLPDSIVGKDMPALIQIASPVLENQISRISGIYSVTGSAYDIKELNQATFHLNQNDSIRIELTVPLSVNTNNVLSIGLWDEDSLKWKPQANSKVSTDKKTVSCGIVHFSRYAILAQSNPIQSTLSVLPNPFSPDRSASDFPLLAARLGNNAPKGTCISFTADALEQVITKVQIKIYTITNDCICSVVMKDAKKLTQYNLWWDGRVTDKEMLWTELAKGNSETSKMFPSGNRKLCRNGRYFVVLTVEDNAGKQKNYMKQIVLVK